MSEKQNPNPPHPSITQSLRPAEGERRGRRRSRLPERRVDLTTGTQEAPKGEGGGGGRGKGKGGRSKGGEEEVLTREAELSSAGGHLEAGTKLERESGRKNRMERREAEWRRLFDGTRDSGGTDGAA